MWISEAACPAETSQLILSSLCFASSELQLSYLPLKKKKIAASKKWTNWYLSEFTISALTKGTLKRSE